MMPYMIMHAAEKELQRSLLMNLAKCSLKLSSRIAGWAVYWASLAVAFVQGNGNLQIETETETETETEAVIAIEMVVEKGVVVYVGWDVVLCTL